MNIVIPLAGKDKNFESRGMIKPLTKVDGKEIIKLISESRPFSYENAIFVILREHVNNYDLENELRRLFGDKIKIVILEEMTEGSPQSILKARGLINNDEPLLIDLADQYLDLTGFDNFLYEESIKKDGEKADGLIPTFKAYYWNQGYVLLDGSGKIKKVSEKDKVPISEDSTACISYFKKGKDFVRYAEQMISKGRVAVSGAYLPSLVYNEMIEEGKKILNCPCELIVNLGKVEGADVFEQINRPLKWKKES